MFLRPTLDGALAVGTDGLFAYARAEVIGKVLVEHTALDDAAEALVQAVKLPSGDLQEDVAIVLARTKSPGSISSVRRLHARGASP